MSKNISQFKTLVQRNQKGNIWTWLLLLAIILLGIIMMFIGMDFGIKTMTLTRVQHAANEAVLSYARSLVKLRDNQLSKTNAGKLAAIGAKGLDDADLSNVKAIDFSFAGLTSVYNPNASSSPIKSKATIPGASSLEYTEASQILLYNIWKEKLTDAGGVNDVRQNQCYVSHDESRFSLNKSSSQNTCVVSEKILSPLMSLRWSFESAAYGQGPCCDKAAKCGASGNDNDFCVVLKVNGRIDPILSGGLPFLHDLGIIKDGNFTLQARAVVKKMAEGATLGDNVSDDTVTLQANQPQVCEFSCSYPPEPKDPVTDSVDSLIVKGQITPDGLMQCLSAPDACVRHEPAVCDFDKFPESEYLKWNPDLKSDNGKVVDPDSGKEYPSGESHYYDVGKKQGRGVAISVPPYNLYGPAGNLISSCGSGSMCGAKCLYPTDCGNAKDGCTKCSEEKICVEPKCGDSCTQDGECLGSAKEGCPVCVNGRCDTVVTCPNKTCKVNKDCQGTSNNTNCVCTKAPGASTGTCDANCPVITCANSEPCQAVGGAKCVCDTDKTKTCQKCLDVKCNNDSDCSSMAGSNCKCDSSTKKCKVVDPPCPPTCGPECRANPKCKCEGDKCVEECPPTCGPDCTANPKCECDGLICKPRVICPPTCGPECRANPKCKCEGDKCVEECPPTCGPDCTANPKCECDVPTQKCKPKCTGPCDDKCKAKPECKCEGDKCVEDDDPCGEKCEKVEDCKGVLSCPLCATAPTSPNQTVCTDCGKSCTQGAECAGSKTGCTVCDGGVCKPPECGDPCALDANCQSIDEYVRQGIAAPNSCVKCSLINLTCIPDQCGGPCQNSTECPSSTCPICSKENKCISDSCNKTCSFDQECANSDDGCNKCIDGTCGKAGCAWDVNNLAPAHIDPVPPAGVNRIKECDMKNLSATNNIDSAFCGKDGDLCITPWVEPPPEGVFPTLTEDDKDDPAVKVFKCACNGSTSGLTWDFQRYAFPWENAGDCPPAGTGQVDNTTCTTNGALCRTQEWHIFGRKIFKCENTTNTTGAEECRWDLNSFTTMKLKQGSACPADSNGKYNNVACSTAQAGQICYKPEAEFFTIGDMSKGWRKIFQCDCAPTPGTTRSCSWDVNGFAKMDTQPGGDYPACSATNGLQYFDGSTCDSSKDDRCLANDPQTLPDQDGTCSGGYCSNFAGKACTDATDCSSTFPYQDSSDPNQQMVKLYRCSGGSTTASWDFQNFLDLNNSENMALPTCPNASTLPGQKLDNSPCRAGTDDRCRTGDRIFKCEAPLPGYRLDFNNFTPSVNPPNFDECPANNGTVNNVDCTAQGEGWRCQKTGDPADQWTLGDLQQGWKKIFRCDCNETLPATGTPTPIPPTTTTSIPTPTTPPPTTPLAPPTTPTPVPIPAPPPAPPITPTTPPPPITVPVPTPTTPPPAMCPAGQAMIQEINMTTKQPYNRCALVCSAGTHLSSLMNWDNSVTDSCVPDGSSTSTECDPGYSKSSTSGNCIPDEFDGSSWIDQSGGSSSDCVDTYVDAASKTFCLDAGESHKLNTTGKPCNEGGQCELEFGFNSPLVIVFDSIDKIKLETITEFSFDGKNKSKTYWINPDLNLAYLVSDFNHNALIDDGTELFGNHTNHKEYANGFEALSDMKDKDKNGIIEGAELKGLMLWFDKNANAKTDKGELIPLKAKGIQKISLKDLINTQKPFGSNGYALPYALGAAESLKGKFDVLDIWFREVK